MARLLARTLTLARPAAGYSPSSVRPLRSLSAKVEFIEIDLSEDSPSSSSSSTTGAAGDSAEDSMGTRRLEDAIHGVLVRRAAPDWLPFVPGGSYWVPPMRRPLGVSDLVGKVFYTARGAVDAAAMTEEERMCFTTVWGWPSAEFFVEELYPPAGNLSCCNYQVWRILASCVS